MPTWVPGPSLLWGRAHRTDRQLDHRGDARPPPREDSRGAVCVPWALGSGSGIQYVIGFSRLENFFPSTMQSADVCPCPYCGPQWDTSALGDIIQLCLPLLGLGEQGLGPGRSQQGRTQSSRAGTLGLCSRDPGKCSDVPGPRQVGCAPLIPWEDRGDLPRVHCHTVVMEAHLPPPPSSSPPPILFSSLHRNINERIF